MTQTTIIDLNQSRLIVLDNGQIIGSPVTRRELKRQMRQAKLQRRATVRQLRRKGLSYDEATRST